MKGGTVRPQKMRWSGLCGIEAYFFFLPRRLCLPFPFYFPSASLLSSRSPIYSHFAETVSGVTTIRAYGAQDRFVDENHDKVRLPNRLLLLFVLFLSSIILLVFFLFPPFHRPRCVASFTFFLTSTPLFYLVCLSLQVDAYGRVNFFLWTSNRWLAVRLQLLGATVTGMVGIYILASLSTSSSSPSSTSVSGAEAGLVLLYAMQFSSALNWLIRDQAEMGA